MKSIFVIFGVFAMKDKNISSLFSPHLFVHM